MKFIETQFWGYIHIENEILKNSVQFSWSWEPGNAISCQFFIFQKMHISEEAESGKMFRNRSIDFEWFLEPGYEKIIYDTVFSRRVQIFDQKTAPIGPQASF